MSEEGTLWITVVEKLIGVILIVVSVIMLYFTATSTSVLNVFTAFFVFLSVIPLIAGAYLIIVRPPE